MTPKSRKKASKGRFNILFMRSQGEVLNLAVSPVILVIACIFAVVFVVVSVNIMNRYFALYLDYRDLATAYDETADELSRLQNLYTYQASVAGDYANLMQALNRADAQNAADGDPEAGGDPADPPADAPAGTGADGGEDGEAQTAPPGDGAGEGGPAAPPSLEDWAKSLPAVASPPEQALDVEQLRAARGRFSFSLLNNDREGRAAQGRLLMLFSVGTPDGRTTLVPFPDFDPASPDPNFEIGPGYNIRAGKTVDGRIELPAGGEVKAVMVAAKSRTGHIVMKKKLSLN